MMLVEWTLWLCRSPSKL